jgi:hypothetical protein
MNMELVKSLPPILNRFVGTAVLVSIAVISAANYRSIAEYAADRLESLQEAKWLGADLTFGVKAIEQNAHLFQIPDLTRESSRKIVADIAALDAPTMERLIYVESLKDTCKYQTHAWKAERAAMLDDRLVAMGLATMSDDAETKERIDWRIRTNDKIAPAKELGAPLSCYKMTLTPEGADVRNVVVNTAVASATGRAADGEVSPRSPQEAGAPATPTRVAKKQQPRRKVALTRQ